MRAVAKPGERERGRGSGGQCERGLSENQIKRDDSWCWAPFALEPVTSCEVGRARTQDAGPRRRLDRTQRNSTWTGLRTADSGLWTVCKLLTGTQAIKFNISLKRTLRIRSVCFVPRV